MLKRSVSILFKTVVPLLLGTYLVWYFFDSMAPKTEEVFYKAVKEANYGWIFLSLLLSLLALFSRAYRWKYLLEPIGYKTSFWHRYHAMMIGYIMNLTIPRAGEASRAGMLYRSNGVPFAKSFGTIVAERVFDVVMLLLVAFITAAMASDDFWKIKEQIENLQSDGDQMASGIFWGKMALLSLFLLGLAAFILLAGLRKKVIGFVKGLIQGVLSVFKIQHPFLFLGHTLLIWVLYITYFGICFFALEQTSHVPIQGIFLAFVAGSLGISLTNGGLGVFPLVVGMVVEYFLKDSSDFDRDGVGLALGMIIWSSQTLLVVVLGLVSFVLLPKNYNDEHVEVPENSPEDSLGQ
jgi:glycosyltransferase 2 family protein